MTSCQNKQNTAEQTRPDKFPVMKFLGSVHDFGSITEGDTISHVFKFKNTGNMPLLISHASTPCGCTVPEWPKDPIAPGAGGEIKVTFNSKNKVGFQNKTVTVYANTIPETNIVLIKGDVVKAKE